MTNETVYWITGASSGIGAALAKQLAVKGNALILSGRNLQALEHVKKECEIHAPVSLLPFELIDIPRFESIAKQAIEAFGHVDVLVNNAGMSQRSTAMETTAAVERNLMEVGFFAPVALSKAIIPHFIERKTGHIVVISSIAGKFGFTLRSSYSASKHALHGYFEALRLELNNIPIYVTMICPGRILTRISFNAVKGDGTKHEKLDEGQRNGVSAERCAKLIDRAIRHKKREILIGKAELIPVFLKRYCPPLFYFLIKRIKAN